MKLKMSKVKVAPVEVEKEEKSTKATKEKKESSAKGSKNLNDYKDEYKDLIVPKDLEISETQKLVFTVKRAGDDGTPHVDIRQFLTTERYTGFTKKGVLIPLVEFMQFRDICEDVFQEYVDTYGDVE